jgi:fluoride exporter
VGAGVRTGKTPASVESDAPRADGSVAAPRPPHVSPSNIGLVAAGGAIGTGLRFGLGWLLPAQHGLPISIFVANVVGAFALGLLLEFLADTSLDVGWSRRVRLGVGTGMLGGFTTYSALATDTVTLALAHPVVGVSYALLTVVIGGIASMLGIGLARHWLRPAISARREQS